jgi:hypothetical protein
LFRKYADKESSFTDCVSFGTMRELRVRDAFTIDHHFKQSGLRSALERIAVKGYGTLFKVFRVRMAMDLCPHVESRKPA